MLNLNTHKKADRDGLPFSACIGNLWRFFRFFLRRNLSEQGFGADAVEFGEGEQVGG